MRRPQELPPRQTETVSARSKMDPSLPKAESVSDAGGTSVVYLRKGKKSVQQL